MGANDGAVQPASAVDYPQGADVTFKKAQRVRPNPSEKQKILPIGGRAARKMSDLRGVSQPSDSLPAEDLQRQVRAVLEHAVDAHRKNIKVYKSLRNLNEVVGTEYGDRVLYELIQNAHDAHRSGDRGRIAVSLTIRSESEGTLYVANGGGGFRWKDVDAIMNLATTAKEIGESIGNKGLGFRSVEVLTDDVRIFSRRGREDSKRFDGYCLRFAEWGEIEELVHADGVDTATARIVARTVPRYLVPLPLTEQPDEVVSYARRGYASVIVLPLRTAESIELARQQVQALADLDMPLLLFRCFIRELLLIVSQCLLNS